MDYYKRRFPSAFSGNSYNAQGNVNNNNSNYDNNDYLNYDSCFADANVENESKSFKGGNVSSTFGSLYLDLSKIEIQGNAVLDISCCFWHTCNQDCHAIFHTEHQYRLFSVLL